MFCIRKIVFEIGDCMFFYLGEKYFLKGISGGLQSHTETAYP